MNIKANDIPRIIKISKLQDFGIFHDFQWSDELEPFKRFNLIYGWNRSGKTTISRVFSSCEKKSTYDEENFRQYPDNGEMQIELNNGIIITNRNISECSLPIKVFNQDFIDDNVSFNPSRPSNPIVYIGEEDIKSSHELDRLRDKKNELSNELSHVKSEKASKESIEKTFLIDLGREISNLLFDKTYNKKKVKTKIENIGLDNFDAGNMLSDEERKSAEETSKSSKKLRQEKFQEASFSISIHNNVINNIQGIYFHIQEILNKDIASKAINRLKHDEELNEWAKKGYDLHKKKKERQNCLFCQNPLSNDFLNTLSNHFNSEYESVQQHIDDIIGELKKIILDEISDQLRDLYPELKEKYTNQANYFNDSIVKLKNWINIAIKKLSEKTKNPFSSIEFSQSPKNLFESYKDQIMKINNIIEENNQKCNNHTSEIIKAKEKLELHAITKAITEINYKSIRQSLIKIEEDEKNLNKSISECSMEISKLENKVSSISTAIEKINTHLLSFFGRKEIQLILDENKQGYHIDRHGNPAKNLSESEKTAIAFSYFIVKVHENDFNIKKGIIFIDDPISSFDANFVYHCFCLIQNNFNESGQIFISTHNFQFFNLVKKWFADKNKRNEEKNQERKEKKKTTKSKPCGFYMAENYLDLENRKSKIKMLDETLKNFRSEYHYLYKKLERFYENEPAYTDLYTISNIARRFFDIFIDFKVPTSDDQREKLKKLIRFINNKIESKIEQVDESKVYKLLNEYSHNSDPMSSIEHQDKSEIQNAIRILLRIIEQSDPEHYKLLRNSST